ncbi:MazG nucleotide pyrophosphohydrolase domain-containing protein [Exiguobacterium oxidotolerans]|uniref:MazG nucleotide pyrophosphohydrolase domain-containing protein n=1 Tax=Exiguobacterium oxidotolerans TaxID=223958 RepID=UPI001427B63A|nr:MazG nucleotide pyrophosphohydrolase domain-containing protein [Exiguobacterium oxidotolerans]
MQEMILLQQKVDETIRALGGYFRPLSGLARLIEEVGEVGEALEKEDMTLLCAELVDVLMISTCLSNQYVTDLASEHQQLKTEQDEVDASFYRLVHEAGQVARVMNGYEGDKPPKKTDATLTVGTSLARLQRELFRFARPLGLDLLKEIDRTNEKNLVRDSKRFALTRDPITEATIDHYRSATGSEERLWGAPVYEAERSLEENVQQALPSLRRFLRCARTEGIEAFVLEAPIERSDQLVAVKEQAEEIGRIIKEQTPLSFKEAPYRIDVYASQLGPVSPFHSEDEHRMFLLLYIDA